MNNSTDVAAAISGAFHIRDLPGGRIETQDNNDGTVTVSDSQTGFMIRAKPSQNLVDTVLENVLPPEEKNDSTWDALRESVRARHQTKEDPAITRRREALLSSTPDSPESKRRQRYIG